MRLREHLPAHLLARMPRRMRDLVEDAEISIGLKSGPKRTADPTVAKMEIAITGNAAWRELERRYPSDAWAAVSPPPRFSK